MKTLAVHLHVYYLSQLPQLLQNLQNLNAANINADIVITLPTEDDGQTLAAEYAKAAQTIKNRFPAADILPVANRGYDIGPFLAFLHHINPDNYAYILKLHTKNRSRRRFAYINGRRMHNALWCDILQQSLIGSPQQYRQCLDTMQQNPDVGLVSARCCITGEPAQSAAMLPAINARLLEMGFSPVSNLSFAAGTMFLARARLFKPLRRYSPALFAPTNADIRNNTDAHVFERLLSALIAAQGYKLAGVNAPFELAWPFALAALSRFLFQKKRTASGKTIVKICKIPVYSKPAHF